MSAAPIHLLTGAGQLHAAAVACGAADASLGSFDRARVSCPQCQRQCVCGPGTTPCPACRVWNARHGARQTTPPGPLKTEKAFQEAVRRLALAQDWLYYHVLDSRKSPPGYPDITLVRGERALFCELKMPGKQPTPAQQMWLDALAQVQTVSAHLWRPEDWLQIEERLR
jgi:hypothetical protein